MSLEERIREAVMPIVPEFAADMYTGDADSYCVLNATEMPEGFGDDRPRAIRYLAQLHWYFPLRSDPRDVKRQIPLRTDPRSNKRALREAIGGLRGCTWPTVTDATDQTGGHLVLEFQAVDGAV